MVALGEEVELQCAERLEELSNMYLDEMDAPNEKTCKDQESAHQMELSPGPCKFSPTERPSHHGT